MQSQTLTQKRYTQAIQQLGENVNILEFLIVFRHTQFEVMAKDARYFFASQLNNNLKLNSFLSHDKLPIPAKIFCSYAYAFFRKVETLSGIVQSLTSHNRLYCDTESLSEEGEFGFAPQMHFPVLASAKMLQ